MGLMSLSLPWSLNQAPKTSGLTPVLALSVASSLARPVMRMSRIGGGLIVVLTRPASSAATIASATARRAASSLASTSGGTGGTGASVAADVSGFAAASLSFSFSLASGFGVASLSLSLAASVLAASVLAASLCAASAFGGVVSFFASS